MAPNSKSRRQPQSTFQFLLSIHRYSSISHSESLPTPTSNFDIGRLLSSVEQFDRKHFDLDHLAPSIK